MSRPLAERPEVRRRSSRRVAFIDRLMTRFIRLGGALVILAVFGIFAFILMQILPLFGGAKVKEFRTLHLPQDVYVALGVDEWGAAPFAVRWDGRVVFAEVSGKAETHVFDPGWGERSMSAAAYDDDSGEIAFGSKDGHFAVVPVEYRRDFSAGGRVLYGLGESAFAPIGSSGAPVESIGSRAAAGKRLVAVVQGDSVHALRFESRQSLMGGGTMAVTGTYSLGPLELRARPTRVLVGGACDTVVVQTVDGMLHYAVIVGGALEIRSQFMPMIGERDVRPRAFDFVFGDVSILTGGARGVNRIFSLYRKPGAEDREFGLTKTFRPFSAEIEFFAASQRNKLFLVGGNRSASIRHATTEAVRWETKNLPFPVKLGAFGPKNDMMFLLDADCRLHAYTVRDRHPEASWKALFGKVWYEGYAGPIYAWQSTGGSDEFEPKLSLVPLLFGTIKGTFYAMLFAVPIALLAALYTSQFLAPSWKATVKPVMEVMASLPSVVLGFMAALWLAPILGPRIPSLLAMVVLIPVAAVFFGAVWGRLPRAVRRVVPDGYEFALFLPVLLGVAWFGWGLGPVLERSVFSVIDPATGHPMADFRLWWNRVMQLGYDQRNALIVGFAMGFAVIPIIFTIAEDSLSNVPRSLVSGSLALGASRWQTAVNVVLPTASPGIFSALMIGLGRAVGETMIVVMATGNTPIMEWNLFSGMRTLSANIAVELPEAPVGGTLYRTLFLGAMLLFLLTFAINTLAEVLRQRLREKYKTV